MKTLPKILQRLIKKEEFSFENLTQPNYGKMDIKYRITWIKLDDDWGNRNLHNPEWSSILVNLKVRGTAASGWVGRDGQKDIKEITKTRQTGWGGYEAVYNGAWGYQTHKRIRMEIRRHVIDEIKDYLKLMGITGGGGYDSLKINTITFEK
jgi:hypothetical protein